MNHDVQYCYCTCPHCAREWQLIDWGCAHHHLVCDGVYSAEADAAREVVIAQYRQEHGSVPEE